MARRPVRGALRLGLQRERDQGLDCVITNPARRPGAGPVNEPVEPMLQEALTPGGHAGAADLELARYPRVGRTKLGAGQHNTSSLSKSLPGAAPADEPLQPGPFFLA